MSIGPETTLIKAQSAVRRGEIAEAERLYGALLERFPRNARALKGLEQLRGLQALAAPSGAEIDRLIALYQQGRLAEVIAQSEALVRRDPRSAMLHNIRGAAYIGLADFARAEAAYVQAAALDPGNAEVHSNHGIALSSQGRFDQAIAAFGRALAIRPAFAEAQYNLGNALKQLQALPAAIDAYLRALAIRPDYADAHNNLGMAYHEQGRLDEALAAYGRALAIKPDAADALHNLGNLLMELKTFPAAIDAYRLALAIRPDKAGARAQLLYAQAYVCDFSVYGDHAASRAELDSDLVPPFTMLMFEDDPERQLQRSRAWAAASFGQAPPTVPAAARTAPDTAGERIRLGYFSADFHNHATLCLMAGLFREHDRRRFEITAYSYGPDRDDAMRAELIGNVDRFIDGKAMTDREIAELARGHGLDIAVDLKGYTQHARPRIFACRPAPVQIAYLGYPGSMGAGFIDYLIADPVVVPPGDERFYNEKIIRLPDSYQPNDNRRAIAGSSASRAEMGLPESGFVFCCFNQSYKISPREFAIWMRLLARVDGSVLWLLRTNEWAEANLRREATARGVDPARLVFAETLPQADHLARLRHADLFLDTFYVNAHTTASDALWAGLPVLTKAGRSFAARVGASLVQAVGLPELVTASEAEYETRALELATNPELLGALCGRLGSHRLTRPLFDTARYALHLETAFRAVHQRQQDGLPPDNITLD